MQKSLYTPQWWFMILETLRTKTAKNVPCSRTLLHRNCVAVFSQTSFWKSVDIGSVVADTRSRWCRFAKAGAHNCHSSPSHQEWYSSDDSCCFLMAENPWYEMHFIPQNNMLQLWPNSSFTLSPLRNKWNCLNKGIH